MEGGSEDENCSGCDAVTPLCECDGSDGSGGGGGCGGGGRMSLTAGTAALAIELSGTPTLRGGGAGTGRDCDWGRYAVAV